MDRMFEYEGKDYYHTDAGELQSKTDSNGTTYFTYDALGNLKAASLPGGPSITYLVDGLNRRVGKKVNDSIRKVWLYQDQLEPVLEKAYDASGALLYTSRFIYASKTHVPDFMIRTVDSTSTTYRIISDHLGSVRLIINAAGGSDAVVQRMDYDEFGVVLPTSTNIDFQPFGFAGGLYDPDTELVRFGARDYD